MMARAVVLSFLLVSCFVSCGLGTVPVYQNICLSALRLISGSTVITSMGRVELVTCNNVRGSVCPAYWTSDDNKNNVNAICATLGFNHGGSVIHNDFGDGNKNFLIENMTCSADAKSIQQCNQTFVKTCDSTDNELAITCEYDPDGKNSVTLTNSSEQTSTFLNSPATNSVPIGGNCSTNSSSIRLLSNDDPTIQAIGNGYVQVPINGGGSFSFISADDWDENDAIVACRELCYNSTTGYTAKPGVIAGSMPVQTNPIIQVQSFDCNGTERRLQDCRRIGPPSARPGAPLAGVQCLPECKECKMALPKVTCTTDNLQAFFSVSDFNAVITAHDIMATNKYPADCASVISNSSGTLVSIPLSANCGTQLKENSSHLIFSNSVRLSLLKGSSSIVANGYIDNMYFLECSVSKTYTVINRYQAYMVQRNATLSNQFNYSLSMDLYENCNFTSKCPSIGSVFLVEVGQWMVLLAAVNNYDNRTKMSITDCDAFPVTPFSGYAPVVSLIKDKCPVESTTTMYSLDDSRQGFQVKAFTFFGYNMVYVTCTIKICLKESNSTECDRICGSGGSGRRKRSADSNTDSVKIAEVSSNQIYLFNNSSGISNLLDSIGQNSNAAKVPESTNAPKVQKNNYPEQQGSMFSAQYLRENLANIHGDSVYASFFENNANEFHFSKSVGLAGLMLAVVLTRMLS